MDDESLRQRVKKAITQGSTGQLREQIKINMVKLRKVYSEQLNSAKVSMQEMEQVLQDLKSIKTNLEDVEKESRDTPKLTAKLRPLRDESFRHSQLTITKENFKHIFDVPLNVATTRKHIAEGKLLLAHKHLSDLEKSRHALLYELHRNPNTNQGDKITLKQYFSEVDKLSDDLGKQLWMIITRTLSYVRQNPQKIVNVSRIIEREERQDDLALKRHETTGFMPPGRPKQWRKRVFEILDDAIKERISGNQSECRSDNKHWLIKHLEMIRVMMIQDLRVIRVACVPCFPPFYNIKYEMLKLYHKSLRSQLIRLSYTLEGNEYVHLLNWVQSYPQLLRSAEIDSSGELEPLLPEQNRQELINKYIATIQKNYREWMTNTINREFKDWSSNETPELDNSGRYQTTTPVFIFQMIDQHLIVAETVDRSLESRVLALSTSQLKIFAKEYKDTIDKYAKIHFCDRERTQLFTPYMIAIANNCSRIVKLFHGMEEKFKKKFEGKNVPDMYQNGFDEEVFAEALNSFKALSEEALDYLLQDLFLDIGEQLSQIGSSKWLNYTKDQVEDFVGNICATLADYFRDYKRLEEKNLYTFVYKKLEYSLARDYIKAFLIKKAPLNNQEERKLFFRRFREDGERLEREIQKQCPNWHELAAKYRQNDACRPFEAVRDISDFLRFAGSSSMSIEAMSLKHKYPDINEIHLTALMMMCENLSKNQARQRVKDMLESTQGSNTDSSTKTIFYDIQLSI